MITVARPFGAGLDLLTELRKDRPVPRFDEDIHTKIWEAHQDNFDEGEAIHM